MRVMRLGEWSMGFWDFLGFLWYFFEIYGNWQLQYTVILDFFQESFSEEQDTPLILVRRLIPWCPHLHWLSQIIHLRSSQGMSVWAVYFILLALDKGRQSDNRTIGLPLFNIHVYFLLLFFIFIHIIMQ